MDNNKARLYEMALDQLQDADFCPDDLGTFSANYCEKTECRACWDRYFNKLLKEVKE